MKTYRSEEGSVNEIKKKSEKKTKLGMEEEDFVKIIQCYPCLMEKSQAPFMKIKKQDALQAVQEQIIQMHGIELNITQIRKKIENMKGRVKAKVDKIRTSTSFKALKTYEKQLLNLMGYKTNLDLEEAPDAEQCEPPDTSEDFDEVENVMLKEEEELTEPSTYIPQLPEFFSEPKNSCQNTQCSILDLQREVLMEQKELNQEQRELNIQQREIFALQKEKLLLEIDFLKMKQT